MGREFKAICKLVKVVYAALCARYVFTKRDLARVHEDYPQWLRHEFEIELAAHPDLVMYEVTGRNDNGSMRYDPQPTSVKLDRLMHRNWIAWFVVNSDSEDYAWVDDA